MSLGDGPYGRGELKWVSENPGVEPDYTEIERQLKRL
jgi:hypothetical protein